MLILLFGLLANTASAGPIGITSIYWTPKPYVCGEQFTITVTIGDVYNQGSTVPSGGHVELRSDYNPSIILMSAPVVNGVATFTPTWTELGREVFVLYIDANGVWRSQTRRSIEGYSLPPEPTGIPEYPSIALPIATIFGLILIFGRKNE